MLLRAFEDNRWPGNAMFAVTPGGFVKAPFPDLWDGERGWSSGAEDFRTLVPYARKAVDGVLKPQVLDAARGRANFLTLGVDLNDRSGKRKMTGSRAARPRSSWASSMSNGASRCGGPANPTRCRGRKSRLCRKPTWSRTCFIVVASACWFWGATI